MNIVKLAVIQLTHIGEWRLSGFERAVQKRFHFTATCFRSTKACKYAISSSWNYQIVNMFMIYNWFALKTRWEGMRCSFSRSNAMIWTLYILPQQTFVQKQAHRCVGELACDWRVYGSPFASLCLVSLVFSCVCTLTVWFVLAESRIATLVLAAVDRRCICFAPFWCVCDFL